MKDESPHACKKVFVDVGNDENFFLSLLWAKPLIVSPSSTELNHHVVHPFLFGKTNRHLDPPF